MYTDSGLLTVMTLQLNEYTTWFMVSSTNVLSWFVSSANVLCWFIVSSTKMLLGSWLVQRMCYVGS